MYEESQQALQALADIDPRFESANAIPVQKATVPLEEWQALKKAVLRLAWALDATRSFEQTQQSD